MSASSPAPNGWSSKGRWVVILILVFSAMSLLGIVPSLQVAGSGISSSFLGPITDTDWAWASVGFTLMGLAFAVSAGRNIALASHDKAVLRSKHHAGNVSLLQKGLRFFVGLPLVLLAFALLVQAAMKEAFLDVVSVAVKASSSSDVFVVVGTVGGILITVPWYIYFRSRADRDHPSGCLSKWGKRLEAGLDLAHSVADLPFRAVHQATEASKSVVSASTGLAARLPGAITRKAVQTAAQLPFPTRSQPSAPVHAANPPPSPPPPPLSQPSAPNTQSVPAPAAERYCPSCGSGNARVAAFCQRCGRPLPAPP
jgi:hypothetical protein